jgi:hypothetical protein
MCKKVFSETWNVPRMQMSPSQAILKTDSVHFTNFYPFWAKEGYTKQQRTWLEQSDLKGTVQRDFLTPVFFTKRRILVSIDMPRSDFEIFQIFAELFVLKLLKNRLTAVNYSEESKTEP